jgi:hypothetical protein
LLREYCEIFSRDSAEIIETQDTIKGEVIGEVPAGNAADIDAGLKPAHEAFENGWKDASPVDLPPALQGEDPSVDTPDRMVPRV